MKLESIVGKEEVIAESGKTDMLSSSSKTGNYALFSEQYLERPVVSGDYKLAITPSASSWRGIPTIDDM